MVEASRPHGKTFHPPARCRPDAARGLQGCHPFDDQHLSTFRMLPVGIHEHRVLVRLAEHLAVHEGHFWWLQTVFRTTTCTTSTRSLVQLETDLTEQSTALRAQPVGRVGREVADDLVVLMMENILWWTANKTQSRRVVNIRWPRHASSSPSDSSSAEEPEARPQAHRATEQPFPPECSRRCTALCSNLASKKR